MSALPARLVRALALPLLFAALWQYGATRGADYAYAFVPLGDVWRSFREMLGDGELGMHLTASIATAVTGLLIGSGAGFLVGSMMAVFRSVDVVLGPLYHALRQVPTIGLIPLIALWFGASEFAIRLLVAIATFEVMALNTYEGLKSVEARYLELGRALTFSRFQTFRRILLPSAFPSILTGLLQAVAFAWTATVGAELLFTVGPGLGVIMERAQLAARMDTVIVCLLFIGAMGFLMNRLCIALGQRVLRWRHSS